MQINIIHNMDCLEGLKQLSDNSIDCCITSPPYFNLRDYGTEGQIGLEDTPDLFIAKIVDVFSEVKRVLKPEGTLWVNIGDSYAGGGGASGHTNQTKNMGKTTENYGAVKSGGKKYGLKQKDLIGIPWMMAFALRADGWYLRQEIIWAKAYTTIDQNFGSTMPESVTDRFVKSHEQLFLLSKSQKYYFDIYSIKKPIKDSSSKRLNQNIENKKGSNRVPGKTNGTMKAVIGPQMSRDGTNIVGHSGNIQKGDFANKRSVWHHNPSSFKEAHFATFPEELIVDCIKAGCPEGGIVLDPFMGAGTTALVSRKLGRNYIGFELNNEYIKIAEKRLNNSLGIFI